MTHEFGNDPAKIERYRKFWNREPVERPMVGFSSLGWFPLDEFKASAAWPKDAELTPDMIEPEAFLDDWEAKVREGEIMDDDMIRGVYPSQAVFWCCGTLGCRMRVLPGNVVAEDQSLSWDEALAKKIDPENPWYRKYMDFVDVLVERAAGRYPVSHGALCGPLDFAVALRGHEQTVIDMLEEPEHSSLLLKNMGDVFVQFTRDAWDRIPRFHGGCFDGQYRLWAPGTTARMQEDAIAVMSPNLYGEFVEPVDRFVGASFDYPFMHLHATSMIVRDQLIALDEVKAFEVNHDVGGPPIEELIPHLRAMQAGNKPILVRGEFTEDELRKLVDGLDPAGLFVSVIVKDRRDSDRYRPIIGM